MSYLDKATKPAVTPPIITIVGSAGAGKSTLGALFPNPIFMRAEDGTAVFQDWDVDAQPTLLPVIPHPRADEQGNLTVSALDVLMAQLRELVTAEHDFKTLVVDTITSLNTMLEIELAMADRVDSVGNASGGFHKGYTTVGSQHAEFIKNCKILSVRKNMSIVFLAHTGLRKIKNSPEETSEYATYNLDMHEKSGNLYINESDAVLFIENETTVSGAERDRKGRQTKLGRAFNTGNRKIISAGDGRYGYTAAKTRMPIPAEIDLPHGENPLLQYIKFFNQE